LTRTIYKASTPEEENRRRRRDRGDGTEDGAEPEGEVASALEDGDDADDATIDVRWPLSPSRMWPVGLLHRQLSEERAHGPLSARNRPTGIPRRERECV
jgi:hypothetical protein